MDEVTGRLRGLGRKELDCIVRRELQSFDTIDFNIHITGENRAKIDRWMVVNHFPVENDHWMVSAQMYELNVSTDLSNEFHWSPRKKEKL